MKSQDERKLFHDDRPSCDENSPLLEVRTLVYHPHSPSFRADVNTENICAPPPTKLLRNYSGYFRTNASVPRDFSVIDSAYDFTKIHCVFVKPFTSPGSSPQYGWRSPISSPIKAIQEWAKNRKEKQKARKGKASNFAVIVNLVCLQLGSGTLTLPWVAAGSSVFGCIIITLLAMTVMYHACTITVQAVEVSQIFDMCKLLGNCNKHNKFAVEVVMYLVLLFSNGLCLVGYMVILADFLAPAVTKIFGSNHVLTNRHVYIIFNTIILLPLCLLENLDKLKYTSVLSVIATFLVMGILILDSTEHEHSEWCGIGFGLGYMSAFNIIVMSSCSVQMCAVSVYENMENRTVKDFQNCLLWAFLITVILFAGFFIPGYQLYGENVSSNVFNNMPVNGLVHNIARFVMFIVILGVYPLLSQPLVTPYRRGVFFANTPKMKVVVPIIIVVSSGLLAMVGFDLGAINSINGAFSFVAFIAIIPAILGIRFLSHNKWFGGFVILCSSIISLGGFIYGSDNFKTDLICFLDFKSEQSIS